MKIKNLKCLIIILILFLGVLRILFDEQYIYFVSGINGNTILHKEICIDEFYDREKLLVVFYESKNKDKIGMVSIRKGSYLIFDCYNNFQRYEVNNSNNTYSYRTSGIKNLFKNSTFPYDKSEDIIFDDSYMIYPNGWENHGELRYIYCGKILETKKSSKLKGIKDSETRFSTIQDGKYYFLIDTSIELTE